MERIENKNHGILKKILRKSWLTFKHFAENQCGDSLSKNTINEIEGFLACGELSEGFIRVSCSSCNYETLVPFSCKKRGFCPSCYSKRLLEASDKFEELGLFSILMRQWVFTLPVPLRIVVIRKPELLKDFLNKVIKSIEKYLRDKAKKELGKSFNRDAINCGTITYVHRFGSSINANPHFHIMVPDGVFLKKTTGRLKFYKLCSPSEEEVSKVLEKSVIKILKLLNKKGIIEPILDSSGTETYIFSELCAEEVSPEKDIASCCATYKKALTTSCSSRGEKLRFIGNWSETEFDLASQQFSKPTPSNYSNLCYSFQGFSLHSAVKVKGEKGVKQLLGYMARPPVSEERLTLNQDGTIYYKFKKPWNNGTEGILFKDGIEFIEKLVSIIPPKYQHNLRYSGSFAPASKGRKLLKEQNEVPEKKNKIKTIGGVRSKWADALQRVFGVDVSVCPHCGADMKIVGVCYSKDSINAILSWFSLSSRAPPLEDVALGEIFDP